MTEFRATSLLFSLLVVGTAGVASAQDVAVGSADDPTMGGGDPSHVTPAPGDAAATAGGYSTSLARRSMTLPEHTLALGDGGPWAIGPVVRIFRTVTCSADLMTGVLTCGGDTGLALNLGASFGITDALQVDANVLPIWLSPEADYGSPRLGATYRFMSGRVIEVGARAGFTLLNVGNSRKVGLDVGIPLDAHFGRRGRLSTGAFLNVSLVDPDAVIGFASPAILDYNLSANIAIGMLSAIEIGTFKDVGESFTIPIGLYGMYTVADAQDRAMLDVGASFMFPRFLTPASDGDAVHTDIWEIGLLARMHLYM